MPRAVTFSRHDGPEVLELVQLDDGAGEFTVGDEVIGHLPRGAQADDLVAEPAEPDAKGRLAVPISTVHPPEQVQEAYRQVRQRPPRGKIVLSLVPPDERPAPATALRA
ncbi:hypothetical protein ACUXZZ_07625 [Streptomyces graminifolii]|uniref:hypothetical protein n=1 Tax=Streptomyces graminifolii TaxID=1266771 RepID=UPI0040580CCA